MDSSFSIKNKKKSLIYKSVYFLNSTVCFLFFYSLSMMASFPKLPEDLKARLQQEFILNPIIEKLAILSASTYQCSTCKNSKKPALWSLKCMENNEIRDSNLFYHFFVWRDSLVTQEDLNNQFLPFIQEDAFFIADYFDHIAHAVNLTRVSKNFKIQLDHIIYNAIDRFMIYIANDSCTFDTHYIDKVNTLLSVHPEWQDRYTFFFPFTKKKMNRYARGVGRLIAHCVMIQDYKTTPNAPKCFACNKKIVEWKLGESCDTNTETYFSSLDFWADDTGGRIFLYDNPDTISRIRLKNYIILLTWFCLKYQSEESITKSEEKTMNNFLIACLTYIIQMRKSWPLFDFDDKKNQRWFNDKIIYLNIEIDIEQLSEHDFSTSVHQEQIIHKDCLLLNSLKMQKMYLINHKEKSSPLEKGGMSLASFHKYFSFSVVKIVQNSFYDNIRMFFYWYQKYVFFGTANLIFLLLYASYQFYFV